MGQTLKDMFWIWDNGIDTGHELDIDQNIDINGHASHTGYGLAIGHGTDTGHNTDTDGRAPDTTGHGMDSGHEANSDMHHNSEYRHTVGSGSVTMVTKISDIAEDDGKIDSEFVTKKTAKAEAHSVTQQSDDQAHVGCHHNTHPEIVTDSRNV